MATTAKKDMVELETQLLQLTREMEKELADKDQQREIALAEV